MPKDLAFSLAQSEIAQLCLTLWDTMDHNLPGSSIQGIFQARVLEWVAISFSRGSSQPSDWTRVSGIAGRRFTVWATREAISPSLMFLILVKFNKPWTNELKTPSVLCFKQLTSVFRDEWRRETERIEISSVLGGWRKTFSSTSMIGNLWFVSWLETLQRIYSTNEKA